MNILYDVFQGRTFVYMYVCGLQVIAQLQVLIIFKQKQLFSIFLFILFEEKSNISPLSYELIFMSRTNYQLFYVMMVSVDAREFN